MSIIPSSFLLSDEWIDVVYSTLLRDGKYYYYLHDSDSGALIGGGPYGSQSINTLSFPDGDYDFFINIVSLLDAFVDLDFVQSSSPDIASLNVYFDTIIELEGDVLGLAMSNSTSARNWFEILLDGGRLSDDLSYRRYALIHEFGHVLGLEHPFDDDDGDSYGGTDPWTSSVSASDTVMSYQLGASSEWPQFFSPSDINALINAWGAESLSNGLFELKSTSTDRFAFVSEPLMASSLYSNQNYQPVRYLNSDFFYPGTTSSDSLYGLQSESSNWLHEFFTTGDGDDFIASAGGRDVLDGGAGDDVLRGGHGQDYLTGGFGDDILYGGGGRNTLNSGSGFDHYFILPDVVSHSDDVGRSHNGLLADTLFDFSSNDLITILGVSSDDVSFGYVDDGLGIFVSDILEVYLLDTPFTPDRLSTFVAFDPSRWY